MDFFEEAIPATIARKLGFAIMTKTLNTHHQISLNSYDRFFPNQDTVPKGGFGNLIALPLQKEVRSRGGSVFVNEEFKPYQDQWDFLSNIQKVSFKQASDIVHSAEQSGEITGI